MRMREPAGAWLTIETVDALRALKAVFFSSYFGTADVVERLAHGYSPLAGIKSFFVEDGKPVTPQGVGQRLKQIIDAPFDVDGGTLTLRFQRDSHSKANRYNVEGEEGSF